MEFYKNDTVEQQSYKEKEQMQKCENEEVDFDKLCMEANSIHNLCNCIEIQQSLENLIYLTSNEDFIFNEKPPSNIITVIIDLIQQNQSKNKDIPILCLQLIGNLWKYPIFIDESLLELIGSNCFQTESLEIALYSINAINNLIESTTKEGSNNFGVDKCQLDDIIFPNISQTPLPKNTNLTNIRHLLSLLEVDSLDIVSCTLKLILNITRVYKSLICSEIINCSRFISLINTTETQTLAIQIICSLAKDAYCFGQIFSPEFASLFISYAINVKDTYTIFQIYSTLSLFPTKGLFDILRNSDLWNSVKTNLHELSQYDLTDLLHFIFSVNYIDPTFLDNYDFWPYIFEISNDFSVRNKVGIADILTRYFEKTINFSTQQLDVPPLSYAVEGGFEFLCEILQYITDPLLFYNISYCLTEIVITSPEIFGRIVYDMGLIENLRNMKSDIPLDVDSADDEDEKLNIHKTINDFISCVSPFSLF